MPVGPDPSTPLWRAAQVFRLLSCIYAVGFQIPVNRDLDRPVFGWLLSDARIPCGCLRTDAVRLRSYYRRGFERNPAVLRRHCAPSGSMWTPALFPTSTCSTTAWLRASMTCSRWRAECGGQTRTRVPAAPSTILVMSVSAPMTASLPVLRAKPHAAWTFGPIDPAGRSRPASSSGVTLLNRAWFEACPSRCRRRRRRWR